MVIPKTVIKALSENADNIPHPGSPWDNELIDYMSLMGYSQEPVLETGVGCIVLKGYQFVKKGYYS